MIRKLFECCMQGVFFIALLLTTLLASQSQEYGYNQQATELINRINQLLNSNNIDEASDLIKSALAKATQDNDLRTQSEMTLLKARLFVKVGDHEAAIVQYSESLKLFRALNNKQSEFLSLLEMGLEYRAIQKLPEALECILGAQKLEAYAREVVLKAECSTVLGVVYLDLKEDTKAWDAFNSSYKIFQRNSDDKAQDSFENAWRLLAAGYAQVGLNLFDSGDLDNAIDSFSKSIIIANRIDQINLVIDNHTGLAWAYEKKADFELAKEQYEICLELATAVNNTHKQLSILSSLGNLFLMDLGDHEKALEHFLTGYKLAESSKNSYYSILLSGSIGYAYMRLGIFAKSMEFHRISLDLSRKHKDRHRESQALESIGGLFIAFKDFVKGYEYLKDALNIAYELKRPDYELRTLQQLISLLILKGDYPEAGDVINQGLSLAEAKGTKRDKAWFLGKQGYLYKLNQQWYQAIDAHGRSAEIYNEIDDEYLACFASLMLSEGYIALGKYREALRSILPMISILKRYGDNISLRWALYYAGFALMKSGEYREALAYMKEAIDCLESVRSTIQEEETKIFFFEDNGPIYDGIIEVIYTLYSDTKNTSYIEEAFKYMEMAKSRALLDMLAESSVDTSNKLSGDDIAYNNSLYIELNGLYKRLKLLPPDRRENVVASISNVKNRLFEFKESIRRSNPEYAEIMYAEPPSLEHIMSKVLGDSGEALLEYHIGNTVSYVIAISRDGNAFYRLDAGHNRLSEHIRTLLNNFNAGPPITSGQYDNLEGKALSNILLTPAISFLKNTRSLIVIPHRCLQYLPFEMLPIELSGNDPLAGPGSERYLIENYSVSYAPSASVMNLKMWADVKQISDKKSLLAAANPSFGTEELSKSAKSAEDDIISRQIREKMDELPNAEKEVDKINTYFRDSLILKGPDALKDTFVRKAPEYSILHIATHGILDELNPAFSGLAFAYDKSVSDIEILYAYEIFNLNLNCDLAVLSACETALGQNINYIGGEGVLGLSRACLYAGVRTLVVSLWKVEDESTGILMEEFYKNMSEKEMNKTDALRSAKLSLMKRGKQLGRVSISYAHPFFWAPFILIGNPN